MIKSNAARLRFRPLFWGGTVLLIALLLALAFRPRAVAVEFGTVTRGALTVTVRDEGRTRVRESYVVSAPLAGRLLRIGNRAGEVVNDGEVVAGILPGDPVLLDERTLREAQAAVRTMQATVAAAQAELQRAQAQRAHAQGEAERVESLFRREAVSQSALDRARLDARAAAAAVASARAAIAMREAELEAARARVTPPAAERGGAPLVELRAPIGGRVLQPSEAVVAAGAPIIEIGDPRDLEVVAEMLSSDAVQVAEGAAVVIEGWGGPALRGRVRLVEPYGFLKVSALGVDEQRVNVVVDLVDPPDEWSALGHGYRVEVAISVWSSEDALQVPVAALLRSAGQWSVFRVEGDRARRVPVEIGRNDGRSAELRSGLKPGDTVVLYPGPDLDDGVRVRRR